VDRLRLKATACCRHFPGHASNLSVPPSVCLSGQASNLYERSVKALAKVIVRTETSPVFASTHGLRAKALAEQALASLLVCLDAWAGPLKVRRHVGALPRTAACACLPAGAVQEWVLVPLCMRACPCVQSCISLSIFIFFTVSVCLPIHLSVCL
jgi:hypothetical protein